LPIQGLPYAALAVGASPQLVSQVVAHVAAQLEQANERVVPEVFSSPRG
jgi:hypothetical protein